MYKVIIVDDEPVIRKGMLSFINWEAMNCIVVFEAGNGADTIEYLRKSSADIIITDIRMPGIDGIVLSRYIHENYPEIKIIILTAYADFSYAQQAIRYNVIDFVVKTNPFETIPEAIRKAQQVIENEKCKEKELKLLEDKINCSFTEICDNFIKDIINGIIINHDLISDKAEELNININNFFLVVYEINNASEDNINATLEEQNKFVFSIKNFLSMAFKDYHHYTAVMNKNLLITIVSFNNNASSKYMQSLLITCNEILSTAEGFMKFTLNIGISNIHKYIYELSPAYLEATEALSESFYTDNHVSVYMQKNSIHIRNKINIHKYADNIINSIQNGNHDDAFHLLHELFREYRKNKEPIENVKVSSMLICSQCFRILANYNLNNKEGSVADETNIYRQIQSSKSINGVSKIICNVIRSSSFIIASNQKQYNYLVIQVNEYINKNYNINISLQSIADYVHVNSSYLSRLYKKKTGESIVDAINKHRIEISKKLLKNTTNKIFEIALSVGIEDPAYFTHVFTKYVGMSPKEYKAGL
ncbi:two-component system response regulator YesN [Ruminiclostridium sufflavum DSM 19573]|uniref:Stage 0 sporulation protein A homolog n=1 Tax=Ruminiclostridium sufflavum DSM 19573 TaxID=1121337 RepID=A0A318XN36_9FIRM|nr:response regulator [Ruminiclostridium sufflavum]PYG88249.1 two-component system response regulator YesN [Ruminiclostridium sufflavum DSM 19573]